MRKKKNIEPKIRVLIYFPNIFFLFFRSRDIKIPQNSHFGLNCEIFEMFAKKIEKKKEIKMTAKFSCDKVDRIIENYKLLRFRAIEVHGRHGSSYYRKLFPRQHQI